MIGEGSIKCISRFEKPGGLFNKKIFTAFFLPAPPATRDPGKY
jgi:hypothetical protein